MILSPFWDICMSYSLVAFTDNLPTVPKVKDVFLLNKQLIETKPWPWRLHHTQTELSWQLTNSGTHSNPPTNLIFCWFLFCLHLKEFLWVLCLVGFSSACYFLRKKKHYVMNRKWKTRWKGSLFCCFQLGIFCEFYNRLDLGYVLVHTRPDNSKDFRVML